MQIGLVGFAGAGRSTLFTALSGQQPASPSGNILTHSSMAVVQVPDPRMETLREMFQPKKFTPATVGFVDFAGIPRTAEKGKAELFARIRDMDALLLVVGAFDGAADTLEVPGTAAERVQALRDEFLFADLEIVERRLERLDDNLKKGIVKTRDRDEREKALMERCRQVLESGESLEGIARNRDEEEMLSTYRFLRGKPQIIVINVDEGSEAGDGAALTASLAAPTFCAQAMVEAEISAMPLEDRAAFLEEYGLEEPVRDAVIRAAFEATRSVPFFTVGEDEVRAWVIEEGDSALVAAGKIHSDIARGFIRAEVTPYDDLIAAGSEKEAKAANKMRLEGKEYVVRNGEIVHFRFSV